MFTKRHGQELAEIKALTHRLGERFEQILEELQTIRAAQGQPATPDQSSPPGKRGEARAVEGAAPESTTAGAEPKAVGAKRARRRRTPAASPAVGAKPGKRRGKEGARAASDPPNETTKRGAVARSGSAADVAEAGSARKRGGGPRKRRQASGPVPSSGSDEG